MKKLGKKRTFVAKTVEAYVPYKWIGPCDVRNRDGSSSCYCPSNWVLKNGEYRPQHQGDQFANCPVQTATKHRALNREQLRGTSLYYAFY